MRTLLLFRRRSLGRLIVRCLVAVVLGTACLVLPWRWIPPPTTAFIVREAFVAQTDVERRWVRWEDMSPNLAIAAVAAEDQKFPFHHGFDLEAIDDALREREEGRIRGASTISQQVAKNLYLWPGQTWARKGIEAYLTAWIEILWPKRRILEVYLNVAEFGPGIFGAEAASQAAFGKQPGELTLAEAAMLVAVLPSPKRMSITDPSAYVLQRADDIVTAVGSLGGPGYLSSL